MHPVLAFFALVCIAVGAGAAGALNMWYDADIDAVMSRTADRPSRGRVQPGEALAFGLTLAGFSVVFLGLMINLLAAGCSPSRFFFYASSTRCGSSAGRRRTSSSAARPGAFPPMIGWAAATGGIGLESILPVSHNLLLDAAAFWALGTAARRGICPRRRADAAGWARAWPETRRQILLYRWLLAPGRRVRRGCGHRWSLAYGAVAILAALGRCCAGLPASSLPRTGHGAGGKRLSASRSSICSCCSRRLLAERALGVQHFGIPFGRVLA
jgi:protoheme IX farnesyltransferase